MKHFPAKSLLALGMLLAAFSFNACQKDGVINPNVPAVSANPGNSGDRSVTGVTYGVTVYSIGAPSRIIGIDENNGNVLTNAGATYTDNNGYTVVLDNLKGICYTSFGQWFITTGSPASSALGVSAYDNALYKVDPKTGVASYFSSICPFGTVSDLEYDPQLDNFVGLLNNTNRTVTIGLDPINGNYTAYTLQAPLVGVPNGYTMKGLTLVRDNTGTYYVGAASRAGAATKLFNVPAQTGGFTTFMTDLAPGNNFSGGHPALGFDIQLNHMAINRTTTVLGVQPGLSEIRPWAPVLGGATGTNFWGLPSFNFEDLSSFIY